MTSIISADQVSEQIKTFNTGLNSIKQRYPDSQFNNYFDTVPMFKTDNLPDHRVDLLQNAMGGHERIKDAIIYTRPEPVFKEKSIEFNRLQPITKTTLSEKVYGSAPIYAIRNLWRKL